jgi:hypothetical protein
MRYRRMHEEIWCLFWSIFVLTVTVTAAQAGEGPHSAYSLNPQKQYSKEETPGGATTNIDMVQIQIAAGTAKARSSNEAITPQQSLPRSVRRREPPQHNAYFCFQKGDLYDEYLLKEVSKVDDTAFWNQIESNGMKASVNQLATEEGMYKLDFSFQALGGMREMARLEPQDRNSVMLVAPYNMFPNNPTYRQNCAGLSLVKLLKDPYVFPTDKAFEFVKAFGSSSGPESLADEHPSVARGDVAVYLGEQLVPQHFSLVNASHGGNLITVISKDNEESIRFGGIGSYPLIKTHFKIKSIQFFHLDWEQIKVYRKQPVIVTVESEATGRKITDAQVELLPREPIGKPPRAVWATQKTDSNGKATFSRYDRPTGMMPEDAPSAFPFELKGRNLKVQVSCPGYEKTLVEEPVGSRPPWDQPLLITVRLKDLRTGWIRTAPVFESHFGNTPDCFVEHDDRTLTIVERAPNPNKRRFDGTDPPGPIIKSTVICEPPPESLQPGQRYVVRARFIPPQYGYIDPSGKYVELASGVFGQYNVDDAFSQYDESTPPTHGNFGPYRSSSGETVITSVECSRYFGHFVSYKPGEKRWFGPPADRPATIYLYLQGLNNWAKLTWHYEAQAVPQALAKTSTPVQPLASTANTTANYMPPLAHSYESQTLAKAATTNQLQALPGPSTQSAPQPNKTSAINLSGPWSVTNTIKSRTTTSTMTLTQQGNEVNFHWPHQVPGDFMRGLLHNDRVDLEIGSNNVVRTRGTLNYNRQTDELQGTLVYPDHSEVMCRFQRSAAPGKR